MGAQQGNDDKMNYALEACKPFLKEGTVREQLDRKMNADLERVKARRIKRETIHRILENHPLVEGEKAEPKGRWLTIIVAAIIVAVAISAIS